ncbi:MAG: lipopolysaccharide biosynthesis protein, partial [Rhizobiales bacterium]|nr:lipopolysaccharide biosynthesis protein [Hyphomicrobiales bacterium]
TERLAGSKTLTSLNELDSQFREIQLELEFNTNIYKTNLSALEAARLEAARRLKFLIVVAEPSLADESEYPQHEYIIVTWAMVLLIAYLVLSLMVSIIREHA